MSNESFLRNKPWVMITLAVILSVAIMGGSGAALYLSVPAEDPVARGYSTACYREQGGDKWVCGSGGEMEFQSGAVLELQSGATVTMTTYTINGDGTFTGTVQGEHLYSTDDAEIADALTAGSATVTNTAQAEHLYSTDDAEIADALTAGSLTVTNTAQAEHLSSTDDAVIADALSAASGTFTGAVSYNGGVYPLGYASGAQEIVCASTTITGANQSISVTGITTVTYGFAWLVSDPGSEAGDPYMVTTDAPSGSDANLVVNVWQDDATAASSSATVGYCAIGDE